MPDVSFYLLNITYIKQTTEYIKNTTGIYILGNIL
jgi:hypothetical protein